MCIFLTFDFHWFYCRINEYVGCKHIILPVVLLPGYWVETPSHHGTGLLLCVCPPTSYYCLAFCRSGWWFWGGVAGMVDGSSVLWFFAAPWFKVKILLLSPKRVARLKTHQNETRDWEMIGAGRDERNLMLAFKEVKQGHALYPYSTSGYYVALIKQPADADYLNHSRLIQSQKASCHNTWYYWNEWVCALHYFVWGLCHVIVLA